MITNETNQVKIFKLDDLLGEILKRMANSDFISEINPIQEINPTKVDKARQRGAIDKGCDIANQVDFSLSGKSPRVATSFLQQQ